MTAAARRRFEERTPRSRELMAQSHRVVAGGVSRNFGYHVPYPVVNRGGKGAWLTDVDGNDYIDFAYNGMSVIHGHAYPPIVRAIADATAEAWAWPGSSIDQIAFAEYLTARVPGMEQIRFTNSGSEAMMLAVKVARHHTKRPLILKARTGYHGTYPDLEAGLHGQGAMPGRALVAEFGDTDAFAGLIAEHRDSLAAVVLEPVLITGGVVPPPDGFLRDVCRLAREAGVLTILDDCLMFRLAEGGSSAFFGIRPDLIGLGKFIGGGIPTGAVCGPAAIMRAFEPDGTDPLYHGGSFNGNVLSSRAGLTCLRHLDAAAIERMNAQSAQLRGVFAEEVARRGIHAEITGIGSVAGIGFPEPGHVRQDYYAHDSLDLTFHLACLASGLQPGAGGFFAMATVFDEQLMAETRRRLTAAFDLLQESTGADIRKAS
jgi:glutamate-1-semialdehyde 2,1-aminomutase